MSKLIMLSGLPASGKSTRAKEIVSNGGNWVRVNRDLLRTMLHFDKWSGRNEGTTVEIEKVIAATALANGYNVVVDDTNLNPKNKDMWKSVADVVGAEFVHEKIETSYFECAIRDSSRANSVGHHVIIGMALQYGLYPRPEKGFVLCDLDGTLCNIDHRLHHVKGPTKDWKSFFAGIPDDKLNIPTLDLISEFQNQGYQIVFVSARPEDYRGETSLWLNKNIAPWIQWNIIIMRKKGDKRPDTEVKQEIFNTYFKDKYPIHKVIDDRPSVIRMWRSNNLDVIDVGKGVEF